MTPKTYTEVCDNTGLTFTSDLSGCLVSSIPEALEATRHSSLQQVLAADLKSTVNLIYSTREKTQLILQHYNATKQVAKDTTKAVCIVPAMDIAKLQPELEGWTLVHTLRKGSFTVSSNLFSFLFFLKIASRFSWEHSGEDTQASPSQEGFPY